MIQFNISANGVTAAQVFQGGVRDATRVSAVKAFSTNWAGANVSLLCQSEGGASNAIPIAGLNAVNANTEIIPLHIPTNSNLSVNCQNLQNTAPIYVEID